MPEKRKKRGKINNIFVLHAETSFGIILSISSYKDPVFFGFELNLDLTQTHTKLT